MEVKMDNKVYQVNLETGDVYNTNQGIRKGKLRSKERIEKVLGLARVENEIVKERVRNLILQIDLVPSTSWFKNMRKMLTQSQWDKIRKATYAKYNHSCGICRGKPKILDCHEMWEYDDENNVQKLKGLIALCKTCHMVKHIGHTSMLASQGKVDMQRIIEHFLRVNNCDMNTLQFHYREASRIWSERSKKKWIIEFGEFADVVKK